MFEKRKTTMIFLLLVIITCFLLLNPKYSFTAATDGLQIWWEIVFPSLLPFFILAELLVHFGVVAFFGVLLEPIMRPLFRVPGIGEFVWVMGSLSGSPTGAKLTAGLRQANKLSLVESERLVSFTNSVNPLFLFGAVGIGFFHSSQLGTLLALCHYGSNFLVGLLMRFHGKSEQAPTLENFSLSGAFWHMHEERLKNKQPIGKVLSEAIVGSMQSLFMIGGFIILFSVASRMMPVPFFSGVLEISLGTKVISQADFPLIIKAVVASMVLGFGGLSIHGQVASAIAATDIRYLPYFVARCLQTIIAGVLTVLLWKPVFVAKTVWSPTLTSAHHPHWSLLLFYVYVIALFIRRRRA